MFNADPGQQAAPDSGPLGLITQARDMAGRRGAEDVVLLAAVSESHLLEGAGEHERAVEAARRATADADPQLLARTSGTVLAVNQAEPLFALGRWDDALAIAAAALDHFLAPGPMNRALLHVITGSVRLARGDLDAASRSVMTARGALRSVRYEDQHQLPLARLEILLALASGRPGGRAGGGVTDHGPLRAGRQQPPVRLAGGDRGCLRGAGRGPAGRALARREAQGRGPGGGRQAAHGGGEAGEVRPGAAGFCPDVRGGRRGRRPADRWFS